MKKLSPLPVAYLVCCLGLVCSWHSAAAPAAQANQAAQASPTAQTAQADQIATPASQVISVVAAENFYGDVITQLGGPAVTVSTILNNPDQDPHLFEASPAVARNIANARLVVYNGAGYDGWVDKLLSAARDAAAHRSVIVAARLVNKRPGDNPHLWYLPATMPAVAKAVHAYLVNADPAHRADYDRRLDAFIASLTPLQHKIADMRAHYLGLPVTATEPVFGYMAEALGLTVRNQRFQLAVMNSTEPAASDIAAFNQDLKAKRVRVLLYNAQTTDELTTRVLTLAHASNVPVVPITETQPAGVSYQTWMLDQLNALDRALSGATTLAKPLPAAPTPPGRPVASGPAR